MSRPQSPARGLRSRWLPHPVLSLSLVIIWLLANNSVSLGHLVLGAILGLLLPLFTTRYWPDAPRLARLGPLVSLTVIFVWDILVANLSVARLVVGPNSRLRPIFVEVPLSLEDPFAISVLAGMITLTPGTLSCDVDEERRILRVHVLDTDDPRAIVETIHTRYQRRLEEIFGC